MALPDQEQDMTFREFYRGPYRDEHRHPGTVALHVAGTVAGLAWPVVAFSFGQPWLVVLFPLVHAVPGLVGHRLFERDATVGDLRVTRTDFPPHWFIAANHLLLLDLVRGRARRQPRPAASDTR